LLRNCNKVQSTFAQAAKPLVRGFSPAACAFGAASSGRRVRKPSVFIRSDVHAVRAGMNIRGCTPLSTPRGELPLWSKLRKFLPSVDTERRNGYNTYRVRPKRSASCSGYSKDDNRPVPAGRLFMSELYDRYRLYFMLERKNERNNQFQHTSHLLSENVLRAARRRSVPARLPRRNFLCGRSLYGLVPFL
jgi:hypothetical protein